MAIGIIKMIIDFTYSSPLCIEEDTRPWIVSKVHYMYFAAFSFWITGLAAWVVTMCNPPDEDFRVKMLSVKTMQNPLHKASESFTDHQDNGVD